MNLAYNFYRPEHYKDYEKKLDRLHAIGVREAVQAELAHHGPKLKPGATVFSTTSRIQAFARLPPSLQRPTVRAW